mmetsp:Transcript_835/g.3466  ORF Transcript_835/g.3466 Transcript_835/m.3466 type:complete len:201 (+) Transcript_835:2680-3282(+)
MAAREHRVYRPNKRLVGEERHVDPLRVPARATGGCLGERRPGPRRSLQPRRDDGADGVDDPREQPGFRSHGVLHARARGDLVVGASAASARIPPARSRPVSVLGVARADHLVVHGVQDPDERVQPAVPGVSGELQQIGEERRPSRGVLGSRQPRADLREFVLDERGHGRGRVGARGGVVDPRRDVRAEGRGVLVGEGRVM